MDYNNRYVKVYSKKEQQEPTYEESISIKKTNNDLIKDGYIQTNTNEVFLGDYIVKTTYYKKI